MEIQKGIQNRMYELKPTSNHPGTKGGVFGKGRILIGRTESCDLIINSDSISAVHAVLEIFENRAVIYDMNSTNGTYVNNDKIIKKEFQLGDFFRLADVEFEFLVYNVKSNSLPPVLDTLEPEYGQASVKLPPVLTQPDLPPVKELPKSVPKVTNKSPSIVYPLTSDPKAEFSEYIFEDKDDLYPIFKYEASKQAVEVIILFKDSVFSIDYLPEAKSTYFIAGIYSAKDQVEFPYLQKQEKIPFIDVQGGSARVQTLPGFEIFHLSDTKKDTGHQGSSVDIKGQDLVRLYKGDLQIFVRNVQAPPRVLAAPIIKRDPAFRKLLLLFFFFFLAISIGFNVVDLPEIPKEDEEAPERLAEILYKKEIPKKIDIVKPRAPSPVKEAIVKKTPPKPQVKPDAPKREVVIVKNPDVIQTKDQSKKPDPGKKTAKEKKVVKQGTEPVKTPTNKLAADLPAKGTTSKLAGATNKVQAYSPVPSANIGHVEVYKSADFKSSVSSLVAKGGSLSGVKTNSASGGSGAEFTGTASGVVGGTGSVKTADIRTNQGSLVGAAVGVLGDSKGAEGLSAKKAIYTAGIPSETVVLGSMDPDVIRRILMEHLPQFRYCYQKELERTGSEVSGVIKLNFAIGASGHVSAAGIDGSSALPGDVKKCVIGVLKGITFPEPMGGGTVEVKQPMNFYPQKM